MPFDFLENKRFLILFLAIILLAGGVFYWQSQKPTPPEDWDTAEVSPPEDFEIIEQEDGLLVKNEKAGFSVKLPKGWEYEENAPFGPRNMSFGSPNLVIGKKTSVISKGCRVRVKVSDVNVGFETLRDTLKEEFSKRADTYSFIVAENFEVGKIKGRRMVKQELKNTDIEMYIARVNIAANRKLYEVGIDSALGNEEICKKKFRKILDTISID